MSEQRRPGRVLASLTAGVVIGGYLADFLSDGIDLNLVAAALPRPGTPGRTGGRGRPDTPHLSPAFDRPPVRPS